MSREWQLYWRDIEVSCQKIVRFTAGLDRTSFERTYDAVVRNLEIIGEAAKHLPDNAHALAPQVDWRKIAGLRDILAHAYFGIDNDILWDVVATKVPGLIAAMKQNSSS